MRRMSALALSLAVLPALLAQAPASQPAPTSPFDADAYLAHVKYLASDELEGRRPGTEGIEKAAEYIARQFAAAGLEPAGDNGTYFQAFEVQRGKRLNADEARLSVPDGPTWQVGKDWTPLPFSTGDEVTAPLAFAGYGIKAVTQGYNDYEGFDASGKVLLIFRYEPVSEDPEAEFGGKTASRYALFSRKAQTAADAGAKALIIVNPLRPGQEDTLFAFDEEMSQQTFDLPIVQVTREVARVLLARAGLGTLQELQEKLDRDRKPLSADLGVTVTVNPGVQPNRISTRNVLGRLKGTGGTDETIVVGAHYDHVGNVPLQFERSDDKPQIHNGADDNASGTAGLLELARVLGREKAPRRNVLFIAFSAEEMGLLGSEHFIAEPTLPLEQIRAMVNFDMIGRLNLEKFTVYGTRSGTGFAELTERAAAAAGLQPRTPPGIMGNSDHAGFYGKHIPVIFPFTGVHKDYHKPTDDWEAIDAPGATKVLQMFHIIIAELANEATGPDFQEDTAPPQDEDDEAMKPAAEHEKDVQAGENGAASRPAGDAGGETDRRGRPGVRLGIVPDFGGGDGNGVVVSTVMENGPAKAAGIQDGDRIVKINERTIRDIYGYMGALREFKPGDALDVTVVRGDKEVTVKITLQEARRRRGAH